MKTTFVVYRPGHGGNFVARLFALSPEVMPLLKKQFLDRCVDTGSAFSAAIPKLKLYQFSGVLGQYNTWQQFHGDWADYKYNCKYRLTNLYCDRRYSHIIYPIHPAELESDYLSMGPEAWYHIDLDLEQWQWWIDGEQQRLSFVEREYEYQQYLAIKEQHHTQSISLTKLLSVHGFMEEYLKICADIGITPVPDQAESLRQDWYKTRVACYE